MELLYKLHALDARLFNAIFQGFNRYHLRRAARIVSRTADGYLLALFPMVAIMAETPGSIDFTVLLVLSMAVERSIYFTVKNSLKRARPHDSIIGLQSIIQAADKFSFPSGHTSAAFVLATSLAVFYPATTLVAYAWAVSVGLSRVVLGVHFPGDTIAGAALGICITLATVGQLGGFA